MVSIYDAELTRIKEKTKEQVQNSLINTYNNPSIVKQINNDFIKIIPLFNYNNVETFLNENYLKELDGIILLKQDLSLNFTNPNVTVDKNNIHLSINYDNLSSFVSCIVLDKNSNPVSDLPVEVYYSVDNIDYELMDTILSDEHGYVSYYNENTGYVKFKCNGVWSSYANP